MDVVPMIMVSLKEVDKFLVAVSENTCVYISLLAFLMSQKISTVDLDIVGLT